MGSVRAMADIRNLGLPSNEVLDERLLSFLAAYHNANAGQSPALDVICSQMGVPEEIVRQTIARLETRGLIHVISRNPLRIMLSDGRQPFPDAGTPPADPTRFDRFLDVEGQRHRLGRFVGQFEKENARAPSLRECMDFVGYQNAGYVRQMLVTLSRLGLVQYWPGVPTRLTAEGRRYYGLKGAEEMEQVEQSKPRGRQVVVVMHDKKPPAHRVDQLCKALADYRRGHAGNTPTFREMARIMGFADHSSSAIGAIARAAADKGLLQAKEPGKKFCLRFTDKGGRKYMPELYPEPAPAAEPEFPEVEERRPAQEIPPAPVEWRPQPTAGALQYVETSALVMELIERGYIVKRGN